MMMTVTVVVVGALAAQLADRVRELGRDQPAAPPARPPPASPAAGTPARGRRRRRRRATASPPGRSPGTTASGTARRSRASGVRTARPPRRACDRAAPMPGSAGDDDRVAFAARAARTASRSAAGSSASKRLRRDREPRLLDQPAQQLAALVGFRRAAVGRGHERHPHRRGGRRQALVVGDGRGRGHDGAALAQRTSSPATRPVTPAPARASDARPSRAPPVGPRTTRSAKPVSAGGSISVT